MSMNTTENLQGATTALEQSEHELARMRAAYVAGDVPFEAIADAERAVDAAQRDVETARREAHAVRERTNAEQRAKAQEDARRTCEASIAVETKRLAELVPLELVTAEDEADLLSAARSLARVAVRVAERSEREAAIRNERGRLRAKIATVREGGPKPKEPPPPELASAVAREGALTSGAFIGVAIEELRRAFPQIRDLVHLDVRDPNDERRERTRTRIRLALGIEREPTEDEIAMLEAADQRAEAARERANATATALVAARQEARGKPSAESAKAERANDAALAAEREAREAAAALRREIDARRTQTPQL